MTRIVKNRPTVRLRHRLVEKLAATNGWFCWICGHAIDPALPRDHDEAATLDHRLPLSKGGTNQFDNLRLAHRVCNNVRADHVPDREDGES